MKSTKIDLRSYERLFAKRGIPYLVKDGVFWTVYQKMVVPVGPVNEDYSLTRAEADGLLRYFKGAVLARSTSGFQEVNTQWHCVLNDRFLPMEEMISEKRRRLKIGLKNFEVKKIDARLMRGEGWNVFAEAFSRYKVGAKPPLNKEQFIKDIVHDGFEDIIEYFGAFDMASGRLIAYSQLFLYGKTEVNCGDSRFHPDFLKNYASYALFYERSRYYLTEAGFSFLNNGFCSVLHETNVQDLLVKQFGFRRQTVPMRLFYRPWLKAVMSACCPFRRTLGKFYPPFTALCKMDEMSRIV